MFGGNRFTFPGKGDETLGRTEHWLIREATAADVSNGDAHTVDNLLLIDRVNNKTKEEHEAG